MVKAEAVWLSEGLIDPVASQCLLASMFHAEHELGIRHHTLHWSRRIEYPWAFFNADICPSDSVLDAGVGDGSLAPYLANYCSSVIMVDCLDLYSVVPDYMTKVLSKCKHLSYRQADIKQLPYQDNSFDKVFCVSVLEHADAPYAPYINELLRVLKPNGRLIITVDVDTKNFTYSIVKNEILVPFNINHVYSHPSYPPIRMDDMTVIGISMAK